MIELPRNRALENVTVEYRKSVGLANEFKEEIDNQNRARFNSNRDEGSVSPTSNSYNEARREAQRITNLFKKYCERLDTYS